MAESSSSSENIMISFPVRKDSEHRCSLASVVHCGISLGRGRSSAPEGFLGWNKMAASLISTWLLNYGSDWDAARVICLITAVVRRQHSIMWIKTGSEIDDIFYMIYKIGGFFFFYKHRIFFCLFWNENILTNFNVPLIQINSPKCLAFISMNMKYLIFVLYD